MAQTGLGEAILHRLVHRFYDRVRTDTRPCEAAGQLGAV
jgi:truncated hemoglobin YjbI